MKKVLAVIIASVFIINISSQPVHAAAFENVLSQTAAYDINKGFTVNAYNTSARNIVFLIQDLHCHYGVQSKIADFLEILSAQPYFNKIHIEGASKNIETSFIKNLPDDIKAVLVKDLFSQGKISGAEYFFLTSKEEIPLYGLEEKELYDGNAVRLEYILATQEKTLAITSKMEKALKALQRKALDNSGKKMLSMFKKYENGQISQKRFYSYIVKQAEKSKIDAEKYSLIKNVSALPQKVNYGKIQKDLQRYMEEAKNVLPYSAYRELNDKNVLDKIPEVSAAYGIDLKKYAALRGYLEIHEYGAKVDPLKVYEEERRLLNDLLVRGAERENIEIAILSLAMGKLKNFMANKGTDEDYKYIRDFKVENLEKLWNKYLDKELFEQLLPYARIYESYYEVNDMRNIGFANKIIAGFDDGQFFRPLEYGEGGGYVISRNVSAAITGGFHTEEIKEMLISKGFGVITLTPKINGGIKEAEEKYEKLFNEQRKAKIAGAYIEGYALKSYFEDGNDTGLVPIFGEIIRLYAASRFDNGQTIEKIIKAVVETYNNGEDNNNKKIRKETAKKITVNVSENKLRLQVNGKVHNLAFDKEGKIEIIWPQTQQEPQPKLNPISLLDDFFKNKDNIYKVYIAPLWEELAFRYAPIIIAAALSISPLMPLVVSGVLSVALHKVLKKALTPKDLIKLSGITVVYSAAILNPVIGGILFVAVYTAYKIFNKEALTPKDLGILSVVAVLYTAAIFITPAVSALGIFFGISQSAMSYIIPSIVLHTVYNFLVVSGILKNAPVSSIISDARNRTISEFFEYLGDDSGVPKISESAKLLTSNRIRLGNLISKLKEKLHYNENENENELKRLKQSGFVVVRELDSSGSLSILGFSRRINTHDENLANKEVRAVVKEKTENGIKKMSITSVYIIVDDTDKSNIKFIEYVNTNRVNPAEDPRFIKKDELDNAIKVYRYDDTVNGGVPEVREEDMLAAFNIISKKNLESFAGNLIVTGKMDSWGILSILGVTNLINTNDKKLGGKEVRVVIKDGNPAFAYVIVDDTKAIKYINTNRADPAGNPKFIREDQLDGANKVYLLRTNAEGIPIISEETRLIAVNGISKEDLEPFGKDLIVTGKTDSYGRLNILTFNNLINTHDTGLAGKEARVVIENNDLTSIYIIADDTDKENISAIKYVTSGGVTSTGRTAFIREKVMSYADTDEAVASASSPFATAIKPELLENSLPAAGSKTVYKITENGREEIKIGHNTLASQIAEWPIHVVQKILPPSMHVAFLSSQINLRRKGQVQEVKPGELIELLVVDGNVVKISKENVEKEDSPAIWRLESPDPEQAEALISLGLNRQNAASDSVLAKLKPASLADDFFENKDSLWYKIYTVGIASKWEELAFRYAPIIIAAALSISPLIPLVISGVLFVALHKVLKKALTPKDLGILAFMTVLYSIAAVVPVPVSVLNLLGIPFLSEIPLISILIHDIYNAVAIKFGLPVSSLLGIKTKEITIYEMNGLRKEIKIDQKDLASLIAEGAGKIYVVPTIIPKSRHLRFLGNQINLSKNKNVKAGEYVELLVEGGSKKIVKISKENAEDEKSRDVRKYKEVTIYEIEIMKDGKYGKRNVINIDQKDLASLIAEGAGKIYVIPTIIPESEHLYFLGNQINFSKNKNVKAGDSVELLMEGGSKKVLKISKENVENSKAVWDDGKTREIRKEITIYEITDKGREKIKVARKDLASLIAEGVGKIYVVPTVIPRSKKLVFLGIYNNDINLYNKVKSGDLVELLVAGGNKKVLKISKENVEKEESPAIWRLKFPVSDSKIGKAADFLYDIYNTIVMKLGWQISSLIPINEKTKLYQLLLSKKYYIKGLGNDGFKKLKAIYSALGEEAVNQETINFIQKSKITYEQFETILKYEKELLEELFSGKYKLLIESFSGIRELGYAGFEKLNEIYTQLVENDEDAKVINKYTIGFVKTPEITIDELEKMLKDNKELLKKALLEECTIEDLNYISFDRLNKIYVLLGKNKEALDKYINKHTVIFAQYSEITHEHFEKILKYGKELLEELFSGKYNLENLDYDGFEKLRKIYINLGIKAINKEAVKSAKNPEITVDDNYIEQLRQRLKVQSAGTAAASVTGQEDRLEPSKSKPEASILEPREFFQKAFFSGSAAQNVYFERMLSEIVRGRSGDFLALALSHDRKLFDYALSHPDFIDGIRKAFSLYGSYERMKALAPVFSGVDVADTELKQFLNTIASEDIGLNSLEIDAAEKNKFLFFAKKYIVEQLNSQLAAQKEEQFHIGDIILFNNADISRKYVLSTYKQSSSLKDFASLAVVYGDAKNVISDKQKAEINDVVETFIKPLDYDRLSIDDKIQYMLVAKTFGITTENIFDTETADISKMDADTLFIYMAYAGVIGYTDLATTILYEIKQKVSLSANGHKTLLAANALIALMSDYAPVVISIGKLLPGINMRAEIKQLNVLLTSA